MTFLILILLIYLSIARKICNATLEEEFAQCMFNYQYSKSTFKKSTDQYLHTPASPSYSSLLLHGQQSSRWMKYSSYAKPISILTPFDESIVQAAIVCSRRHDLQIRVKSGGHDYEGLSSLCKTPFVIIDMVNLRSINISIQEETAWVQAGATLGELYYNIAHKSGNLGFPAGLCAGVGVGGHFSGGGIGTMVRKYGLAADNVVDVVLIDANGRIKDRKAMGEDVFWAIRGGGGASFGVILAWKIKLVRVPDKVTGFTMHKILDQQGTSLVHRWQNIADKLPNDLFIRLIIQNVGSIQGKKVRAAFNSLFLGPKDDLIALMDTYFPSLGLKTEDCTEMSWIESVLYFANVQRAQPPEVLLNRSVSAERDSNFKGKSDFVVAPIPENALQGIWERILQEDDVYMIMDPLGGKMSEISESEIAFPHRRGNLYSIQYMVQWKSDDVEECNQHMNWIRELYDYMSPFVSKSPRAAYINYKDLDLGINTRGNASYSEALSWGEKYFKANFKKLALVKTKVDPANFFRNEQSIPLFENGEEK